MSWNLRIRQVHRWTSIAFTLAVIGLPYAARWRGERHHAKG